MHGTRRLVSIAATLFAALAAASHARDEGRHVCADGSAFTWVEIRIVPGQVDSRNAQALLEFLNVQDCVPLELPLVAQMPGVPAPGLPVRCGGIEPSALRNAIGAQYFDVGVDIRRRRPGGEFETIYDSSAHSSDYLRWPADQLAAPNAVVLAESVRDALNYEYELVCYGDPVIGSFREFEPPADEKNEIAVAPFRVEMKRLYGPGGNARTSEEIGQRIAQHVSVAVRKGEVLGDTVPIVWIVRDGLIAEKPLAFVAIMEFVDADGRTIWAARASGMWGGSNSANEETLIPALPGSIAIPELQDRCVAVRLRSSCRTVGGLPGGYTHDWWCGEAVVPFRNDLSQD